MALKRGLCWGGVALALLLACGWLAASQFGPPPVSPEPVIASLEVVSAADGAQTLVVHGRGLDSVQSALMAPDSVQQHRIRQKLPLWGQLSHLAFHDDNIAVVANNPRNSPVRSAQWIDLAATPPRVVSALPLAERVQHIAIKDGWAYLALVADGLGVVDGRDPTHPQLKQRLQLPGRAWHITLHGRYAYIALMNDGLCVLDIADPSTPRLLAHLHAPQWPALSTAVYGGFLYVAHSKYGVGVYDLQNPGHPSYRGQIPDVDKSVRIAISAEGLLATGGSYSSTFAMFDLTSDPLRPTRVYRHKLGRIDGITFADGQVFLATPTGVIALRRQPEGQWSLGWQAKTPHDLYGGVYAYRNQLVALSRDHLYMMDKTPQPPAPVYRLTRQSASTLFVTTPLGLLLLDHTQLTLVDIESLRPRLTVTLGAPVSATLSLPESVLLGLSDGRLLQLCAGDDVDYVLREWGNLGGRPETLTRDGELLIATLSDSATKSVTDKDWWLGLFRKPQDGPLQSITTLPLRAQPTAAYSHAGWLYLGTIHHGLMLVDVRNPEAPRFVTVETAVWPEAELANIYCLLPYGSYLLATSENHGLEVLDISKPDAPVVIGRHPLASGANKAQLAGNQLVVGSGNRELWLFDLVDPHRPYLLGALPGTERTRSLARIDNHLWAFDDGTGLLTLDLASVATLTPSRRQEDRLELPLPPSTATGWHQVTFAATLANGRTRLLSGFVQRPECTVR